MIESVTWRRVRGALADDDRKLHLPVDLARALRDDHVVVGSGERGCRLEEDHRFRGKRQPAFCGVIAKVQSDADDLTMAGDWWAEASKRRHSRGGSMMAGDPFAQAADAPGREESLIVVIHARRHIDAGPVGKLDPGDFVAGCAEANQSHGPGIVRATRFDLSN